MTLACFVVEPPRPVSVSVYVVVTEGETETKPPDAGVTIPTPWSIEAIVAFVLAQDNVNDAPAVMVVGLALNVPVGAGATVTVACLIGVPPTPVSVSVYIVVTGEDTDTEPPDAGVTAPTPLLIEALVAFVAVHESVDEALAAIEVGLR